MRFSQGSVVIWEAFRSKYKLNMPLKKISTKPAQPFHGDALGRDDQHRRDEKADAFEMGVGCCHRYRLIFIA